MITPWARVGPTVPQGPWDSRTSVVSSSIFVVVVVVAVECPLSAKQWTLSGSWKKWESGPSQVLSPHPVFMSSAPPHHLPSPLVKQLWREIVDFSLSLPDTFCLARIGQWLPIILHLFCFGAMDFMVKYSVFTVGLTRVLISILSDGW